jgi:hypothetical protein
MPASELTRHRQRLRTRARGLGLRVTRDREHGWTATGPDGIVAVDLDDEQFERLVGQLGYQVNVSTGRLPPLLPAPARPELPLAGGCSGDAARCGCQAVS